MTLAVFDSSALLALILKERGDAIAQSHLAGAMVSAVNLAELCAKLIERGATAEMTVAEVKAAGIEVVAFDERQAIVAGELRARTREFGLSLGDRACLALAQVTERIVVTADRAWMDAGLPLDVRLIR